MPKRVIDFDALWASDKLASCAEWAQSEYAWLYGLADASGSFELTNLRVIWGRVAAIRKNLSLERLQEIFEEFIARGLLFTWEENGKRYGHWTGSDLPGRLPARSWRARLQKLAPPVPAEALAAYSSRFGGSKEGIVTRAAAATATESDSANAPSRALKCDLEEAQAQDLGLDSDGDFDLDLENPVCLPPRHAQDRHVSGAPVCLPPQQAQNWRLLAADMVTEQLLEIYERERGELPPVGVLTPERRLPADLYAGIGPRPADCGVRVNPAALERIRAREARLLSQQGAGASDAGSRCGGDPSFALPRLLRDPAQPLAVGADGAAPKPIAFDAHSRASPALLNS